MTPVEVRQDLVNALKLDLVGPDKGSELEQEILPQAPSRWYLTGFLVPSEASAEQKTEEASQEEVDQMDERGGSDDANTPEPPSAARAYLPAAMGMRRLVRPETHELIVGVAWGDYRPEREKGEGTEGQKDNDNAGGGDGTSRGSYLWKRTQKEQTVPVTLPASTNRP